MEYQNIKKMLENTSNQSSKLGTENLVEINDESRGKYNVNREIRFNPTMIKSRLCEYSNI